MKKSLLGFMLLCSSVTFASDKASQILLNAMTVCPVETNPTTILKKLGGNSFFSSELDASSENTIVVNVVHNPRLYNPLIMAPTRLLGKIRVQMSYPEPGYGLVCKITSVFDSERD